MTANTINAIQVIPQTHGGLTWLESRVTDSDEYLALPKVVEFQGVTYFRTGWNSDTGTAYFKTNGFCANSR